ncbi:MAG: hypothetical protein J5I59_05855 [Saprospiraceae bacterium]|nr:hypothetical protein [Saprospiraceae bacterium]
MDAETLKSSILSSLKKADGSPVDELINSLDEIKVKKLFPKDESINSENYAHRLLKNLKEEDVFLMLFEIVE